jgi:hypothetical protein
VELVKKIEMEWHLYRTRFLVKAKQLTRRTKFTDALGREHRGEKGDYLVESCDGTRSIQRRKIFEDVYVAMEQPGSAQFSEGTFGSKPGPSQKKSVQNHRLKHESRRLIA